MCEQRCSWCLVCHNSYLSLSFFCKTQIQILFAFRAATSVAFFFSYSVCSSSYINAFTSSKGGRAAFWKHFCLCGASSLFPSGFGGWWCHVCDVHVLTHSYLIQWILLRGKVMVFFCRVFFPTIQSFSEPSCFPSHPIFRLSKFEEPLYLVVYWKSCSHL